MISTGLQEECLRFSDGERVFRVLPAQRKLFEGETEIKVGDRCFDLLLFFLRHPGKRLTKDEIIKGAWNLGTLDDNTLQTHIHDLKKAIGRESVKALYRVGYQFVWKVAADDELTPVPRPKPTLVTLPYRSTSAVKRANDLSTLSEQCERHRVVTIVGVGGIGKTWLATELAWQLAASFAGGVHLIDLSPVKKLAGVATATARVLGIALRSGDAPMHVVADAIGQTRMMLIFDSCEYVAEAVGDFIGGLIAKAPNLTIVATSERMLHIPKGAVYRVPTLDPSDAIDLFIDNARAGDSNFSYSGENNQAVAEICRRLDYNPLALEMAAGLVPSLGLARIRAGVNEQRFKMLDASPRAGAPRHRTLTAMVEWNYGLLDEADQHLFRRLACFSGSFSCEAATAVANLRGDSDWDIVTGIQRLVDKSLVVFDGAQQGRYRLLETLRLHAATKLRECDEVAEIAERHAIYYAELFEQADNEWESVPDEKWTATYGPEIDNARSALDYALSNAARLPLAMRLGSATAQLWQRLGLSAEGRVYLDRLVDLISTETPRAIAASLLRRAGSLWRRPDRLRAVKLTERSVEIYSALDDRANLGCALAYVGGDYVFLGRHTEAQSLLSEARGLLSDTTKTKSLFNVLLQLGSLAFLTNDIQAARRYYAKARDMSRLLTDTLREYLVLMNLAEIEFRLGAVDRAFKLSGDAVLGFRAGGHRTQLAWTLVNLASYKVLHDRAEDARDHIVQALPLLREEAGRWLRLGLQVIALLGARNGRHAEAAQLLGFVNADYAASGEVREPTEQLIHTDLFSRLESALSPEDIDEWTSDGSSWSLERAAAFATERLV